MISLYHSAYGLPYHPVPSKGVIVGMKKILVFHKGHSPHGKGTRWVMHKYMCVDDEAGESSLLEKDRFVLCRVFLGFVFFSE